MARCIGGHTATCWRCDNRWAHTYVVSDQPLIEETRCGQCGTVLDVNGKPTTAPQEQVMVGDGDGRR